MLIRLALDPQLFSDQTLSLNAHRRFLQLWGRMGILCDSGIREKLDKADSSVKTLWLCALKHNESRHKRQDLGINFNDLSDHTINSMANSCDLVCLSSIREQTLLAPDKQCLHLLNDTLEFCDFQVADLSCKVKKADSLAARMIPETLTPEEIWKERFDSLARSSRYITIVDRYAAENTRLPIDDSELGFFIKTLNSTDLKFSLILITGYPSHTHVRQWLEDLKDFSKKQQSLKAFNVNVVGNFGSKFHGRFIRFEQLIVELDTGLEVFKPNRRRPSMFSMKAVMPEHTQVERDLISNSRQNRLV